MNEKVCNLKYAISLEELVGKRVYAYRNLGHADVISLADSAGRVLAHVERVLLVDVEFRVRMHGFRKAFETGEKGPHAYVIGYVGAVNDDFRTLAGRRARYNPKTGKPYFFPVDNQEKKLERTEFAVVEAIRPKKSQLLYDVHAQLKY